MDMAQDLSLPRFQITRACGLGRAQSRSRMAYLSWFRSPRLKAYFPTRCANSRRPHRTGTTCSAEADGFFESSVVQGEVDRLQADYQVLLKLGRKYGQFDRQGKCSYISEMKGVLERWQIFNKRLELSDDFTAKVCAKQLRFKGGPMGLSNLELVQSLYSSLDEMRADADGGP